MIAGVGALLTAYHVYGFLRIPAAAVSFLEPVPSFLSVVMTGVGVALAYGRLVESRSGWRLLGWTAAGTVALSVFGWWMFATLSSMGFPVLQRATPLVHVATFGALVGVLVGVYDVQNAEQKRSIERVNRVNDTLRIATQELVNRTERDELERAVCDRLVASDSYEAVWIGRYDEQADQVRPTAWAGFDDDYVDSLVVTVDDTPTGNGAGGRAIETRELQCVLNPEEDPSMAPWRHLLESRGVEALSVVPIYHDDTVYGFFSVYADRQNVFDAREREVLAELGETIGHAVASLETTARLAERERELERQNQRLDQFVGVVSHDLRNPLNVADGYLELAREADGGDPEGYLDRVGKALSRMEELVDDLLTLAREGEAVDQFRRVPLDSVAEEAWSTAGGPSATLRLGDDLGAVSGDPSRVRQLLENLFRNSVEHGGAGVTVSVTGTDTGFAVTDDGPGVPEAERETVFETGYSTNDAGTGFGLDIVRSVAEAHGWSISLAESRTGGARFEFSGVERLDAQPAVA
ncbi:multi-sensor signal transduction histidine kinase [Candidatus Halobonum tyrrellensis G22]|uniref:histidine kinase n=1 Tax=Candidatus Halobonum tyrrellensis G22 TaxID=1324957 RepID=V4IW79_9EURY|nr:multi-sensor signal transduction histidine kinase [Candidatus Halobonum tyrrellensis G22]